MDVDSQIFKAWSYYLLLQAVSGATSNIDTGGGATGTTFNTKKEIEAIYYVPSWLSRCCLDCVFIDSMKIIYQTYVMKSKPYSFHLHFPQILRSFNKLPGGGSSSLYLIIARFLSGTRARSLMEPVTRWLQLTESWLTRFSRQIIFSWNLCYEYFRLILTWAWDRGHGRIVSSHCVRIILVTHAQPFRTTLLSYINDWA